MKKRQAGQATLEFVLITILVITAVALVMSKVPLTFSQASPYLGFKIQSRLETGRGFTQNIGTWESSGKKPKGGIR